MALGLASRHVALLDEVFYRDSELGRRVSGFGIASTLNPKPQGICGMAGYSAPRKLRDMLGLSPSNGYHQELLSVYSGFCFHIKELLLYLEAHGT